MSDEKQLEKNHEETMKKHNKDFEEFTKKYKALYKANTDSEAALRKEYKKASNMYKENMNQYDNELKN